MAEEYEAYSGSRLENTVNRRTPGLTTDTIIEKFIAVGTIIAGKAPYAYQLPFIRRCLECVLEREADELTALWARQTGKSESLSFVAAVLMVLMPVFSVEFQEDDRFNFYDEKSGTFKSYKDGFWIGIFAPKKEQAGIIFNRIRRFLQRPETINLLREIGTSYDTNNGDTFRLSSGSFVKCSTASDQANIEGATLHLAIMEESQDISDQKANKSIGPMLAASGGSLIKIGTANSKKSHFYNAIRRNERRFSQGGKQNHFLVPWQEAAKYNQFYEKFIQKEIGRLGETSDEFMMNFACRFTLERGLAIPENLFINRTVVEGPFSNLLPGPRYGMSYVAGIDFGKVHDSTVVIVTEVNWATPHSIVSAYDPLEGDITVELYGKHVVDMLELQGDDYEAQYHIIKEFLRRWPLARITLDNTGVGTALGDRFKALYDGVEVEALTYSDDSKDMLGRELLADIHNGLLTWPGGPEFAQTNLYRKFRTQMLDLEKNYKNGKLCLAHPDIAGAHDDVPQALSLSVHAACTKPFGGEVEETSGLLSRYRR